MLRSGHGIQKTSDGQWLCHPVYQLYAGKHNKLFSFLHWEGCRVKSIRTQRQIYCPEEKDLTKAEYMRLLRASRGNCQLNLILQTICSTGIRVSELKYFTVEAVYRGEIRVSCKNKTRTILVPGKLRKYCCSMQAIERFKAAPSSWKKTENRWIDL